MLYFGNRGNRFSLNPEKFEKIAEGDLSPFSNDRACMESEGKRT